MLFTRLSLMLAVIFHLGAWAAEDVASGEAGEPAAAGAPLPKEQREYYEKASKLTTLTNRIIEGDKQFKEVVEKKNNAKSPEATQQLLKEMVEINNQRNKDVDAYNKLKSELALRYPNQGEHLNRKYQTQSKRSLEDLEGVAGLDELLTRTKKIVEKKFAPFMEEERKETRKAVTSAPAPAPEAPAKLRLEK